MSSRFMTKAHLTGNKDLLIAWTAELNALGHKEQLAALIRDSFERVSEVDDIDRAITKDTFWQTVMEGIREDSSFSRTVEEIMRLITPFEGDKSPVRGYSNSGGGLA